MANYTGNIVRTYEQVGKKEDIADVISDLSPTETPFLSGLSSEKPDNVWYQWQEDELAAVDTNNAHIQGADATDNAMAITVMRDNYTQIFQKTVKTANTVDAIKLYGRAKESAYQVAKKGKEIKRDLETALVGTKQTKVAPTNAAAGKFAGYQAMIDNSVTEAAPDGDPGTGGTRPSPLTETLVLAIAEKLYNANADAEVLSIKPADALKVANFAYRLNSGVAERNREIGQDRKIVNTIDVYEGPFGTLRVVLNRWQATDNALVYSKSNWKLQALRPWFRQTLAITGDAVRQQIIGEYGLKHTNFKASGLITNLS